MEEQKQAKQRILSGIQPTGVFTLGNYMGAIVNWEQMQEDYDCAYFIADLHSLTVRQEPAQLRKHTTEAFALLLACGIDPEKSLVFVQSHVHTHAEMGWILCCSALMGDLGRMTQFKDKSAKHADNINAGLFTYPVLMAGDILLYQADYVPVGQDQRQHLEFTRDLAERFNHFYGNVFKIPDGYYPKAGAKVMSLQDPTSKMSKSDPNPNSFISILDDRPVILNKFKRAVTDSEAEIVYREGKDGINNLITIYSVMTGKSIPEVEKEFEGQGYGTFKMAVGESVADRLQPIRDEFNRLVGEKKYLEELMAVGADRAYRISRRTLEKAKKKVGLLLP